MANTGFVSNRGPVEPGEAAAWLRGHTAIPEAPALGVRSACDVRFDVAQRLAATAGAGAFTEAGSPAEDETEIVCRNGVVRLSQQDGVWWYRGDGSAQLLAPDHRQGESHRLALATEARTFANV